MDRDEETHHEILLKTLRSNLQFLKEQEAQYSGINIPIPLYNSIRETKQQIEALELLRGDQKVTVKKILRSADKASLNNLGNVILNNTHTIQPCIGCSSQVSFMPVRLKG